MHHPTPFILAEAKTDAHVCVRIQAGITHCFTGEEYLTLYIYVVGKGRNMFSDHWEYSFLTRGKYWFLSLVVMWNLMVWWILWYSVMVKSIGPFCALFGGLCVQFHFNFLWCLGWNPGPSEHSTTELSTIPALSILWMTLLSRGDMLYHYALVIWKVVHQFSAIPNVDTLCYKILQTYSLILPQLSKVCNCWEKINISPNSHLFWFLK